MEKLLLVFIAFFLLSACSGSGSDGTSAFALDDYTVVSGSFSAATRSSLTGTGTIRFTDSMPSMFSSRNFAIDAQILENGGSITLVTNSTQPDLTNGVRLKLTRSGIFLNGSIQINSGTVTSILPTRLVVFDATNFRMVIDVHNLMDAARILIWDQAASPYSLALVNMDSSVDTSPLLIGSGSGIYNGLILDRAHITKAQSSNPKVSL